MIQKSALAFLFGLFCVSVYIVLRPQSDVVSENPAYKIVPFEKLVRWQSDQHEGALESFKISCGRLINYPDDREFNGYGVALDWKEACRAALEIESSDSQQARLFFEEHFSVLSFYEPDEGVFTGYYAPLYKGSKEKTDKYTAPLYAIPKDLQAVNLGVFDQRLSGRSIIGEVVDGKFVPYKERKVIELGALDNQNLELVWLEKIEETFFLQIQGSGFIELEDGEVMHLGYAQRNGRPYRAIGQFLIESGDIAREDMSLQAILEWMEKNPEKSNDLMWQNPSFVFFQERASDKPVGSLGVGLTPGRSLAVDREYIPLGMPLWLETYQEKQTDKEGIERISHLSRLVIAQDTGGAIKGKVRGDVYWGIGDQAERKAGPMKDKGTYYLFVPKKVATALTLELR